MMEKIERHIQISGDRGSGCALVVVREENHSALPNQNQTTNINPGPGYKTASGTRKKMSKEMM